MKFKATVFRSAICCLILLCVSACAGQKIKCPDMKTFEGVIQNLPGGGSVVKIGGKSIDVAKGLFDKPADEQAKEIQKQLDKAEKDGQAICDRRTCETCHAKISSYKFTKEKVTITISCGCPAGASNCAGGSNADTSYNSDPIGVAINSCQNQSSTPNPGFGSCAIVNSVSGFVSGSLLAAHVTLIGDTDGNSCFSNHDIVALQDYIASALPLNCPSAADITGDGIVDSQDLNAIEQGNVPFGYRGCRQADEEKLRLIGATPRIGGSANN